MAKIENQQEAAVVEAVSKTEQFFQQNGKKVVIALAAVVLVVVGGYLYKSLVIDGNAEKYLSMYSAVNELVAEVINAQNYGLRGDIASEQGNYEAAVALYKKAVSASKNIYTAPLYLYKQVLSYAALGNKAEAQKCLDALQAEYAMSTEAREAEKVVGTL